MRIQLHIVTYDMESNVQRIEMSGGYTFGHGCVWNCICDGSWGGMYERLNDPPRLFVTNLTSGCLEVICYTYISLRAREEK